MPWGQGMPYFCINFLEKTLLDSIWAAAFVGPKIGMPSFWNRSTIPAARGASGPTTVRSMFSSCETLTKDSMSSEDIFSLRAIAAVPAFPGATNKSVTLALCFIFQASACSLAPLPITKILNTKYLLP